VSGCTCYRNANGIIGIACDEDGACEHREDHQSLGAWLDEHAAELLQLSEEGYMSDKHRDRFGNEHKEEEIQAMSFAQRSELGFVEVVHPLESPTTKAYAENERQRKAEADAYASKVKAEAEKRLAEEQESDRFERDVARAMQERQLPNEPMPSEHAVRAERILPAPVPAGPPAERQVRSAPLRAAS
jgi:hypothetical protein